ncbi:hypothetical protein EIP91_009353 [Steccherinum ochraceum]|uniref:Uncharacterized protein n=1 Tax=Steccherinum ochraceum TaxID=92696 RepID=A0A4R0RP97_9APHY|nr:hypothetical protein EIP91_009353 [Steccherinum ochraceum]
MKAFFFAVLAFAVVAVSGLPVLQDKRDENGSLVLSRKEDTDGGYLYGGHGDDNEPHHARDVDGAYLYGSKVNDNVNESHHARDVDGDFVGSHYGGL